jgi:plastocyanin
MRIPRTTAIALAGVLLLAGCGSDDTPEAVPDAAGETDDAADEPDDDGAPEETDDDGDDAVEGSMEDGVVTLRNINVEPDSVTVQAGDTVTFVNSDIVRHTVTSGPPGDPDGEFDEDLPDQGDEAEITFDEPGTFEFYCDLHRNMTGEVVVE